MTKARGRRPPIAGAPRSFNARCMPSTLYADSLMMQRVLLLYQPSASVAFALCLGRKRKSSGGGPRNMVLMRRD
jgi:hypothetical protein